MKNLDTALTNLGFTQVGRGWQLGVYRASWTHTGKFQVTAPSGEPVYTGSPHHFSVYEGVKRIGWAILKREGWAFKDEIDKFSWRKDGAVVRICNNVLCMSGYRVVTLQDLLCNIYAEAQIITPNVSATVFAKLEADGWTPTSKTGWSKGSWRLYYLPMRHIFKWELKQAPRYKSRSFQTLDEALETVNKSLPHDDVPNLLEKEDMSDLVSLLQADDLFRIGVQFPGTAKTYSYKHTEAIEVGSKIVVDSPQDGYTVVTVVECEQGLVTDAQFPRWKWVVGVIDDAGYKERVENDAAVANKLKGLQRKQQLKSKLAELGLTEDEARALLLQK